MGLVYLPFPDHVPHGHLSLLGAPMKLVACVTQEALSQWLQPPDGRVLPPQSLTTSSGMSSVRTQANQDSHSTSGINGHWEGFVCLVVGGTGQLLISKAFSLTHENGADDHPLHHEYFGLSCPGSC